MENYKEYYIGGKAYSTDPAHSRLMCREHDPDNWITGGELYRTHNGAWFLVEDGNAKVVSEDYASTYMDVNSCCIQKENYIAVYGEPAKA